MSGVLQIRDAEHPLTWNAEHPLKAFSTSIVNSRELGSEMEVSDWQLEKAHLPIIVTESGSVTDVSEEHS